MVHPQIASHIDADVFQRLSKNMISGHVAIPPLANFAVRLKARTFGELRALKPIASAIKMAPPSFSRFATKWTPNDAYSSLRGLANMYPISR